MCKCKVSARCQIFTYDNHRTWVCTNVKSKDATPIATLQIMARYLRENQPAVLQETYAYYADKTAAPPYPTREGIEPVIAQVMAGSKAGNTKLTFDDVADQSFVRELAKGGFIQSLYRK
jgi:hypothetical protein